MTVYAVGDIHGKREMLAKALVYLREVLRPGDYTVFLGDYIDRGEDSRGVVEDLFAFRRERPDTLFLRGNHEQWLLDTYDGEDPSSWLRWGGAETLHSYGLKNISRAVGWREYIPPEHLTFFRTLPLEHRLHNVWFVHAGVRPCPGRTGGWQPNLWVRDEFIQDQSDYGRLVVFGHTPQMGSFQPLVMPNKVGLDTGAVFGGRLSVAGFDDALDYHTDPCFSLFQVCL